MEETPGIDQGALVDAAVSGKATLTEMLLRLEKRGLVTRRGGVDDKRRREVELTSEGRELPSRCLPCARQLGTVLLGRFSPQDRAELLRMARALTVDPESR